MWRSLTFGLAAVLLAGSAFVAPHLAEGTIRIEPRLRGPADLSRALSGTREVEISASDGVKLRAWEVIPAQGSGRTILVLHGVGSRREDMGNVAALFLRHGYRIIAPDLRGHGASGGEFTSFGVLEGDDTARWAKWAGGDVYVFGASLGGAVAIEALPLARELKGAIAESAFVDFESIGVERVARSTGAPGGLIRWLLVRPAFLYVSARYGVSLTEASPLRALQQTTKPVLLIHGADDRLTAPEHSRRLRAAAPERIDYWEAPAVGHAEAYGRSPAQFERHVMHWLAQH